MGRKKKVPTVEDFSDLNELMVLCATNNPDAIRAVGEYVEVIIRGRFGKLLEIYFRGKESELVNRAKLDLSQAKFYLGMISAVKEFQLDLEQFVLDKDRLDQEIVSEKLLKEEEQF
jgi:hypothetical protein